jgi:PAS domain S-box-containing protein
MADGDCLSVEVLGRFSVMQSMVTMLPNELSMLDFVCQGMQDIGGVKKVTYHLFDKQDTKLNEIENPPDTLIQVLTIKHKDTEFGVLNFELSNSYTFQLYLPFISNFVTMLGVIFDQQLQRRLKENLMKDLERRVQERTKELQEKETDLRITLNSIGDAVISTDLHGLIRRMNPVAEQLTGWSATEANGRLLTDVFTIYDPENMTQVLNPVKTVLMTGQTIEVDSDTILIARNRTQYQIADSIAPIRDDSNINGVVLIFRDVTESFRTAEALKQKSEELDNFFELTPNLLSIIKKDGGIIRANKAWTRILGYGVEELYTLELQSFIHPEDKKSLVDSIELLQVQDVVVFVNRCRNKENTYQWIEWHWTLVGDKIFSVAHDITARKQAEFELKSSLHEKEILLQELYHRTRNNMQVITSILDMQAMMVEDTSTIGILEDAQNRIRAMGLVQKKLYESKNLSRINMGEYLKELACLIQSSSNIPESQVVFRFETEEVWLLIDFAVPCGLVINELLTNSFKYAFPNHRQGLCSPWLHRTTGFERNLVTSRLPPSHPR